MAENTEDFIRQHAFGNPQLKPDEKRAFLGNFRERVALALTIAELNNSKTPEMVVGILRGYPEYRMYLNGKMADSMINQYMKLAIAENYQFTILVQNGVRVEQKVSMRDFGLVIASPTDKIKKRVTF
ncbi:DUF1694 domain-containing protein [Lentilactobacillus sp. SPB1-3]|uniref:DUF1694 domain-containing protein n=1 Tax=Lentilactobacillus terminaliae TaxID=3003483 RepID=A0ACD5DDR1_9LACO|nr:DUF1694 domain-containing protein [Lentilactobacillus sp. SPB1-3]MCZ0977970.1 DUF1694 domain-containing protein [Lentilactobacillus sp. SPB1-3]